METSPGASRGTRASYVLVILGIVLFVLGSFLRLVLDVPEAAFATTLGLVMTAVGGLAALFVNRTALRGKEGVPRGPPSRLRRVGLAMLGVSGVAFVAWFALPSVHAFDGFGAPNLSASEVGAESSRGWVAVRGPYYSVAPVYDVGNDTTYVIWGPGSDESPDCFALRIHGDHRAFHSTGDKMESMILQPHEVRSRLEPLPAFLRAEVPGGNATHGPGCDTVWVLEGTFSEVSTAGHAFSFASGLVFLCAGFALVQPGATWGAGAPPGLGALAGFALVHAGLSGGGDPLSLMLFVPVAFLFLLVVVVAGAVSFRHLRRPFRGWSTLPAFGFACVATFIAFAKFYPSPPFG